MQFEFSETDEQFRQDMRRELSALLPPEIQLRQRHMRTQASNIVDQRRWLGLLNKRGWSVPAWPVEHGGTGWSALQRFIFEDVLQELDAPDYHWIGSHMVGPVLIEFGSVEQQDRFLPGIRSGEHIWAQGFSEPGSGSDLASLRTSARREGDHYVVNGSKIWTSGAHHADWGFFLVKTDTHGKAQASISVLLIDLRSPGLSIRPIEQIDSDAHVCQVFLEDVRVPADQLVGAEGMGWTYAKFLLDHERTTSSFIFWIKRELRRTQDLAATLRRGGKPLSEDPMYAYRMAKLVADIRVHEWSVLRILSNEKTRYPVTAGASVLKLRGSEIQQAVTDLHTDMLGLRAPRLFAGAPDWTQNVEAWPDIVPGRTGRALITRASTIYGGTKQIQKNLLAKLALGL